jgi:hypothetical protein
MPGWKPSMKMAKKDIKNNLSEIIVSIDSAGGNEGGTSQAA